MELLRISTDLSFPNDSIYDSSIIIINEDTSRNNSGSLSRSNSSSSSRSLKPSNLDITRISDRILVTSRCWPHNTEQLASFLNSKYKDNYLIWNIGTPESYLQPSAFEHRIIPCLLPKSQNHTLKSLFHLCHSMLGWLELSAENVIIIQCTDGWSRSGLMTACLLKFHGVIENIFDALNLFQSRRLKTNKLMNSFPKDSPTIMRYLKYFNEIVNLKGRAPNPTSLCLHQIILSTIPNFDGFGTCQPGLELFQGNELLMSTNYIADKSILSSDIYIFKDDYNIIFRLKDLPLERDIHLHIFHCHPRTGQRTTILSFTFNTAFFHPGVIRLRPDDLEMPYKDSEAPALLFPDASTMKSGQKRFNNDFSMDLIILPVGNIASNSCHVDYSSTVRNNPVKNLLRLSQMHPTRPDRKLLPPLLLQSFPKFYSKLALQLTTNDIHRAHEFLENLRKENGLKDLERSFLELTNVTRDEVINEVDLSENTKIIDKPVALAKIESNALPNVSKIEQEEINTPSKKPAPLPSFSGIGIKYEDVNVNDYISKNIISDDNISHCNIPPPPPPPPLPAPRLASFVPPPPPFLPVPRLESNAPPPPPPFPNGTVLIPPTPGAPQQKPRIKNALHWNELSVDDDETNSVWHEIANGDFETQLALNTKQFEELFCIDLRHEKRVSLKQAEESESDTKLPVVIDIRRANNVGIGLARFQRRYDDFTNLLSAIYEPDSLDLDDFLTIKSILPLEEEVKNLKLIKKSDKILFDRMGKAEQFLYAIAHNDPMTISKAIEYKIFELTCWQDFSGIKEKFGMISSVLEALKTSAELKIVLKATLDLGNLATYEYGKFQHGHRRNSAFGFTLDSLCRLHEVKSVDGQSNLLIFLTASLAQAHPEVLFLPGRDEFKDLDVVKLWSDKQLITEYKLLKDATAALLSDISNMIMNDFWLDARRKIERFKEHLESSSHIITKFQQTWLQTKAYFGRTENGSESSAEFEDVSIFLSTIWQFFRNFETAVKQVNKQRRKSESVDTFKSWSSSNSSSRSTEI